MVHNRFIRIFAEIQFINLRDFSDDMERLLKETSDEHIQHLEELSNELIDDEERDRFWDFHIDRVHQLRDDYPSIHRSSMLVSCMSNMEKVLVNVHDNLITRDIGLRDLRHFGRKSTYRKVLESIHEVISLDEISSMPEWDQLLFYYELRNRIVHDVGKVPPRKHPELFEKINNYELVSLNRYDELVFEEGFVNKVNFDCIKIMKKLFEIIDIYFKQQASK